MIDPYYFRKNIPYAINDCYLREGAVKRLLKAVQLLLKNHYFLVYDGWRPYRVQLALYEMLKTKLIEKEFSGNKLINELQSMSTNLQKIRLDPPII